MALKTLTPYFSGHVWSHHCCAAWSEGVVQSCNLLLLYVDKAVFGGISQVYITSFRQSSL